ncbi:MAG: hypothetical protein GPJ54_02400 [Candidatus Heimdallarchaeota archaeon]|nr:hypothetical protein [Candidatus Heimdallarchaeota archaeon]
MTNEYITFKNLASATAIVTWLFGVGLALFPEDLLDLYDVTLLPEGLHMTKLFGAAFILIGLLAWFVKDLEPSDMRRNLSISFIVGNSLGAILMILNIFDDDTDANGMEWLNVFLYLIFVAGFVYLEFIDTDDSPSKPTETPTETET